MTIYNLHYVGQGLYSIAQFESEAKEHGVARAMPARIIQTLKWGEPVLLAQWVPDREAQQASRTTQTLLDGQKGKATYKRIGSALVFGYFNVTGLNMNVVGTDSELARFMLKQRLDVIRVQAFEGGKQIARRCGSCTIGATFFVQDSIESIMRKAAEIEKELGTVRFKWFVTGSYTAIPHVTLEPAKFSRGVVKVEVEGDLFMLPGAFQQSVSFMLDYERKIYQPKEAQE